VYKVNNLIEYTIGRVVQLQYGLQPYGIIASVNQDNGQCLIKTAKGPRVYKFTSLKVIV